MVTVFGLNVNGFNKSRRNAQQQLLSFFAVERPDFICLQETRGGCPPFLERFCREEGYSLLASYDPASRESGVAILGRHALTSGRSVCGADTQVSLCRKRAFESRFLEVKAAGLRVASVYAYSVSDKKERKEARLNFYQCLGQYMDENANHRVVIATDLNLCLSRYDVETDCQWRTDWATGGKQEYQKPILKQLNNGWTDVWRRVHGTEKRKETVWTGDNFAGREAYGIDHQLVSRPLASVIMSADLRRPDCPAQDCKELDEKFRQRVKNAHRTGFSDHALTIGVFAISAD